MVRVQDSGCPARTLIDSESSVINSHYEVKSLANKLFLCKKYFTMSMGVDE